MYEILNESYKKKMGHPIMFADLGHTTENFNFFVTQTISKTLTLTSANLSGSNGMTLMNKLITLTVKGKYSLIESVIERFGVKLSGKTPTKAEVKAKEDSRTRSKKKTEVA